MNFKLHGARIQVEVILASSERSSTVRKRSNSSDVHVVQEKYQTTADL